MRSALVLSAALFGVEALGASSLSSTINQKCFTQYSLVRPRVLTTTDFDAHITLTATQFVSFTPHTTMTPLAITSSVTTTHTNTGTVTAPTTTDTYTTSKTITQTNTEVDTSSYTQTVTTSTTVTISSTTTVAAPSGFTGLAQWPGYLPKRNVAARRDALASNVASVASTNYFLPTVAPAATHQVQARKLAANAVEVPYAVSCTRSITYFTTKTSTVTVPTSTTTLSVRTSWSTITVLAAQTITVIPADVTSIVTILQSITTTSTTVTSITSTTTATNTIFAPSATFLAQCGPTTNMISSAVGQKIGTISYNPAFVLQSLYPQDQTGYGCCAQCATTANCAGYAQAPQALGGACYYIISDGRCNNQQSFGDAFHYYNTNGNGYTVGNGQCGYLSPVAGMP
ncbi:hypothetical protein DOTSEDRAFT_67488 [Dothistroma septosporum NZE10]|uniref:Apple domain-containing protein n=1 Tax=Dothistroma septosporum (strain NZE10 / CBS 128990) TaxID=675120 RepID=N1PYF4_DOTSN|nr:hypothetical protein DOTSEDRAFT_67488 [Dothistroma septosporum NZE10]